MKKKIYYWSPCLNPVGTIISTINSVNAINKYSKNYEAFIINSCGEWNEYLDQFEGNSIRVINLTFSYFSLLPKKGFLGSRFSYIIIFLISFLPLLILLKKDKPKTIILHLITSLPLMLLNFFKFDTEFILRISGYPKMNFLRKFFWSKLEKKIKIITCPTIDLKSELIENKVFKKEKLRFLPDAIISYDKLIFSKNSSSDNHDIDNQKKSILSVGRLTKQKNFSYLIEEFKKFNEINKDYKLYIIGEGEEREKLEKKIEQNGLNNQVYLLGYKKNVFKYMKKSEVFILSSLWEEVGFAMVEAAINNCYLICSDCPNGPSEFLNNGKNGILFKNNTKNKLYESLLYFSKLKENKLFEDKLILKKNALKYSKFKHFLKIKQLIN